MYACRAMPAAFGRSCLCGYDCLHMATELSKGLKIILSSQSFTVLPDSVFTAQRCLKYKD